MLEGSKGMGSNLKQGKKKRLQRYYASDSRTPSFGSPTPRTPRRLPLLCRLPLVALKFTCLHSSATWLIVSQHSKQSPHREKYFSDCQSANERHCHRDTGPHRAREIRIRHSGIYPCLSLSPIRGHRVMAIGARRRQTK